MDYRVLPSNPKFRGKIRRWVSLEEMRLVPVEGPFKSLVIPYAL
jgi:hypothetical protein